VGAGSTAAAGLRRTEVGDGLPANWRGLEFRNWGLVELRNCKLSIRGLPAVVGTYLGFWGAGVTAIPGVVGFLVALDSAKFVCTRGGADPTESYGFKPHHLFPVSSIWKKKRIFLCARFPPCGEAGDVRIWEGVLSKASSRTCRRRFFDCGSYQFCARCREGKKKNLFVHAIPTSW
jgi:hypothetical protein